MEAEERPKLAYAVHRVPIEELITQDRAEEVIDTYYGHFRVGQSVLDVTIKNVSSMRARTS